MRNRRSLSEASKEKLIRDSIKESLETNKEYIVSRPKHLNKVDATLLNPTNFPYSAREESSSSKETDLRYTSISDLEVCKSLLEEEIGYVIAMHRSQMNAMYGLMSDYKKLERDANRNLLLSLRDDPFSFGVTDDFSEYDFIDFSRSTTTAIKDKITLGAKRIADIDLPIKSVSTKLISRNGVINSIDELSDTYNLYRKDGSSFKVKVETNNSTTFVELQILLELSEEVSIDKLSVVARSLETNDTENILVSYSKDGVNYLSPELGDIERLENLTSLFDIYDTDIKYVKVRLQKRAADITTRFRNQYIFSVDYIGAIDYEFESSSTFYSKAYEIVDEDGNPVNFTMASLEKLTCCVTPNETSISFYLSKDGENYMPANYFGESGTIVEFSNQISRSVFSVFSNENRDLISVDNNTWKLNNYIPTGTSFLKDTLVVKRNINKWKQVGNVYSATIDIENNEGMFFDIKDTTCKVDGVTKTGRFFLAKGSYLIETEKYEEVKPRLSSEALLRAGDSLYPKNHKYIFEGYNYPATFTGERVYVGCDRLYEVAARRVTENFFNKNSDKRDIYFIKETSSGSEFYLNKADILTNEEIYIDCRIDDVNVDNKVYVKAVLQTENQFKSPRIDSIQVRVI